MAEARTLLPQTHSVIDVLAISVLTSLLTGVNQGRLRPADTSDEMSRRTVPPSVLLAAEKNIVALKHRELSSTTAVIY